MLQEQILKRAYYSASIEDFLKASKKEILGELTSHNNLQLTQQRAWDEQIKILQDVLRPYSGSIYFEYSIPRMGQRIDVVVLIGPVIFVLEFKVGEKVFTAHAIDQVCDYALDLKNFHEPSHQKCIVPVVIATDAKHANPVIVLTPQNDNLFFPIKSNTEILGEVFRDVLAFAEGVDIDHGEWEQGRYSPTPTIIEAAMALYNGHAVHEISRSDASAINLSRTSEAISEIIRVSRERPCKTICFVTGVPGAGKTLVGLDVATKHIDKESELYSVYLSGNGPLVSILREALTRDKVQREKAQGNRVTKKEIMSEVKMFIQNIHNFRDDCITDTNPPIEHVALFDEAQRAWNLEQTSSFMRRKKNIHDFNLSEPEFLIQCLDRYDDWAVIVCLVGGGQEINTGEAGISEWIDSLNRSFPEWHVHISPRLSDAEYAAGEALRSLEKRKNVFLNESLHLSVSMRSFRAESVSLFVKQILDCKHEDAQETFKQISDKYPIVLTRDLQKAKAWLKNQARGTERYGIVVSSQAQRLKPLAIDVRVTTEPIHWFLDGKEDVRSSYYLEDVATEFDIQGLELDWACVTWDGDFRYAEGDWQHFSFVGSKWHKIKKAERQLYLKNAYRVLLTRARQGMVIVVPEGDSEDHTRKHEYYDTTFEYLKSLGLPVF